MHSARSIKGRGSERSPRYSTADPYPVTSLRPRPWSPAWGGPARRNRRPGRSRFSRSAASRYSMTPLSRRRGASIAKVPTVRSRGENGNLARFTPAPGTSSTRPPVDSPRRRNRARSPGLWKIVVCAPAWVRPWSRRCRRALRPAPAKSAASSLAVAIRGVPDSPAARPSTRLARAPNPNAATGLIRRILRDRLRASPISGNEAWSPSGQARGAISHSMARRAAEARPSRPAHTTRKPSSCRAWISPPRSFHSKFSVLAPSSTAGGEGDSAGSGM